MTSQRLSLAATVLVAIFMLGNRVGRCAAQDAAPISFTRDVRPILSDRCFACHGPDANAREADLRLDQEEDAHQWAIVPGSPDESPLWERISSDDPSMIMPPEDSHKESLNPQQQEVLRRWIQEGAAYEAFWAFQKPEMPEIPESQSSSGTTNPIDQFVIRSLKNRGRSLSESADPRTLIRRVTLDLTGLPPTLEQVNQFLERVQAQGKQAALEQAVDQLLASPHYGEHMARYWLDVVRYADTNGMHKDFYRNHWAYRDWVIRAFQQDAGYDQFITHQLAGDLLPDPSAEQLTGTAFLRLHLIIDRGTALPEESFHKNVIDRVTSVGTAFLGLTVHCAQCHDHKYDPISQKEFYSLYAFFNNLDGAPETVAFPRNGLQPPFISLASESQKAKLQAFDNQLQEAAREIQSLQDQIKALSEADQKRSEQNSAESKADQPAPDADEIKASLKQWQQKRKAIERQRDQYNHDVPYAMVMKEREEIRPTHVLIRGQYDAPGDAVQRATPAFLPPLESAGETATRLDLARWLTSGQHPLTSRVAVNRIWQQMFGVGLVKTSEDFGAQGEFPTHPELLDYLAVSFQQNGWKFKPLIRQVVLSKTYQQSSVATEQDYRQDPDNRWLARGSRYRMDAEMIRDQILLTSGLLVDSMYGPSVKPPQPPGLWKAVTMIGERFEPDQGQSIYRRSVYTYWKRGMPPPQMTILNAPIRDACVARRERTNTPSQALLLLNEPQYLKASRTLAQAILEKPEPERISHAWQRITCRMPDKEEISVMQSLREDLLSHYRQNPELADQACAGLADLSSAEKIELAAWTLMVNTLYNMDITRNRD